MNGPLVSIAVNNYNYERYLREAIDSALAQTYPRTEIIVVDDGSTDGSREIISAYGDRIVPVLKENGGQASAFNAGFAACSGEIVIFLDADDYLIPEAVERVMAAWSPELSKVQYLLEIVDSEGGLQGMLEPTSSRMSSGDLRNLILLQGAYTNSPTSGNAFSRESLERLLPMPEAEWRISADGYLLTLAPFFGNVLSLSEQLGFYRIHESNNYSMQKLDVRKIRGYIAHDLQKQELLREFGKKRNMEVAEDLVLRLPSHVRCRLASLRMEPELHPCPEDRAWYLALKGITGCWRNVEFALRKKFFYSVWFLLVGMAPGAVFRILITLGLMRTRRPRIIEFMNSTPNKSSVSKKGTRAASSAHNRD